MNFPSDYKQEAMLASRNQKKIIEEIRSEFFDDLIESWSRKPEDIDIVMDQGDAFFTPDYLSDLKDSKSTVFIKDSSRGILAVSVTPPEQFRHKNLRWVYSIIQAGDWIRYGVLIQGDPSLVLKYERQHEHVLGMERVWDRSCDYQFRDSGGLLLEWRFVEPNFFEDYAIRERFTIIARHLHFRLGKIMLPVLDDEMEDNGQSFDRENLLQDSSDDSTIF